ncbi:hypothetical protein QQM39_10870 [Streptomyces sp. DT2A-34]|uniref:hypothetical protein n=1 Tax=Streptomyces sp. DT2A-34 TaxID=3051182 RepID=UPI00265C801E|nr:hypothetical protein [Streptomyces sp. DT2A-34]MDO0911335.1 hypothetical protein [Streptomyces sp. DT2A-34]
MNADDKTEGGGPLSKDLVVSCISAPDAYASLSQGAVDFIPLANPVGIIGALAIRDTDGAFTVLNNEEQGEDSFNSGMYWIMLGRKAKERGLTPAQFIVEIQQSQDIGGWPLPGRLLPVPLQSSTLPELTEYIENGVSRPDVGGRELRSYAAAPHEAEYSASQQGFVVPTTDEIRKMAAYARNPKAQRWWTVVDRSFPDLYAEQVPLQHVFGGWVIEPDGTLSDFIANREYQPTLVGLGWRAEVNEFEGSIQRRYMGRESDADFGAHFRAAELIVPVGEDGGYALEGDVVWHPVLRVYTSEGHLPAGEQLWARATGAELSATLPRSLLLIINPGGRPETRITLREAVTGV